MNVRTVDQANTGEAVRILAEAFRDDPVLNWTCNNPATLDAFFEMTLPVFIPHGLTYVDAQGRGAAAWLGPDQVLKWPVNWSSVATVLALGGFRGVYRMLLSGHKTEHYHPKTPPHYYLFAIGVTDGCKGQGLGTALIREILRRCDDEGLPAYLENSKEANLRFYEGHGFTVRQQIRFAPSAPPVWLMWREPRSGSA